MDIFLTANNVPVVIHDNNLQRLANVSNNVSDMTTDEMKEVIIRAGGAESRIPTLKELAKEVKCKTKLLLKFKTHGQEKVSMVDITIHILEKEGILEETIFHTSEMEIIEEYNEKNEDLTIGYVFIRKVARFPLKRCRSCPSILLVPKNGLLIKE